MHNSVKLHRLLPEYDFQPFTSSGAGEADRNVEFFQIKRSNAEKNIETHTFVLYIFIYIYIPTTLIAET